LIFGRTPANYLKQRTENHMANNDILRSIRDALTIDDATMIHIFKQSGRDIGLSTITALTASEDDENYIPCSDPILGFFLDGLIIHKRGRQDESPVPAAQPATRLTRNAIVKKLRIALDLKEDDLVSILKAARIEISKNDLSALFRKEGNKHYKECSDRIFRGFLEGLAQYCRAH
jgi:uncharacterized protein YehS (DUF1456 family)